MHSTTSRRILTGSIVSLLAISASIPSTAKADATWVGDTSADWNNAANWSSDPADPTGTFFINGAGITPVLSADSAFFPVDIKVGAGTTGRLDHTAGTLSSGGGNWSFIGQGGSGNGTYNLADTAASGGTLTGFGTGSGSFNTTRLYVADGGSSVGTMAINTTGTVTVSNDIYIGSNGTGVVKMDAGTLNRTGGWGVIGVGGAAGNGTLNMSGGLVTGTGDNIVGLDAGSTGALNMTGGTFTSGGWMQVGRAGNGTVTVNGASAILNANDRYVLGFSGSGTSSTTVSAGTLNVGNWLIIGQETTQGTLTISGTGVVNQGLTDAGSRLEVTQGGTIGTGRVNLDGGTLNTNGITASGDAAATSLFNFNGGTLKPRAANGGFMAGLDRANVRNGGAIIDTNGFDIAIGQALMHSDIGGDNATDGGLTKNGTGVLTLTGRGDFNGPASINGGTLRADPGNADVNGIFSSASSVTVNNGGTLEAGTNGLFGWSGTQTKTITVNTGGTLRTIGADVDVNIGNVNLAGGTIASGGASPAWGSFTLMRVTGGKITVTENSTISALNVGLDADNSIEVAAGKTLSFTGTLTDLTNEGQVALVKAGAGTVNLSNTNTYTGPTTVNAGTLLVSGSISGSTTTVNGGNLGGTGTTGAVTVNDAGAIGAGNSIGTLTTGALTLNDTAEFQLEINIASDGLSATTDLVNATTLSIDTDIEAVLTLNNLGSNVALTPGMVITFINYDDSGWNGGTFAGYDDDSTFSMFGNDFKISYDGVDDATSAVTLLVVPEPGSPVLLLGGIGAMLGLQRFRRRLA